MPTRLSWKPGVLAKHCPDLEPDRRVANVSVRKEVRRRECLCVGLRGADRLVAAYEGEAIFAIFVKEHNQYFDDIVRIKQVATKFSTNALN